MRLLTHNSLRNNTAEAKGRGFPLQITCGSVRIHEESTLDADQQLAFVQKMLPTLDWPALVQVRSIDFCEIIHLGEISTL